MWILFWSNRKGDYGNEKTGLLLVALLTLTQSAYAMLPFMENNNIAAAQLYGSQRKGASDLNW